MEGFCVHNLRGIFGGLERGKGDKVSGLLGLRVMDPEAVDFFPARTLQIPRNQCVEEAQSWYSAALHFH